MIEETLLSMYYSDLPRGLLVGFPRSNRHLRYGNKSENLQRAAFQAQEKIDIVGLSKGETVVYRIFRN